jgi:predicted nucleotidyltransferase component of viral defense system
MPIYNKIVLTDQARQLGFIAAPFEKMTRLTEILRFLNGTDELRDSLALKGGTAINLTLFSLPRLSVDIDLDFTENLTREETRTRRDRINELLERYMAAEGYTIHEKSKRTHILDSYIYSYINIAGNSDNIKVEINYSLRAHALHTVTMTVQATEV